MPLKKYLAAALVIPASFSINAAEYDFDGDGYADIAVRRASTGVQYILNSTGSNVGSDNGDGIQRHSLGDQETDIPISGDFDGDGIWDIGVRRPSTFEWIIRYSSTGEINTFVFGKDENDIPVPADYDGDGITDLAVRRPSTQYWYIKNSSGVDERTGNSDGITREIFGRQSTDIPVPADYDGDGKTDLAVRRTSNFTWYIKNSSGSDFNSDNGDGVQRIVFGKNENDIAVPADYNGDGYADVAVRRPSNYTWYIKNSNGDNYNSSKGDDIQRIVFGKNADDIPVVADYDGDGIADIAVRRASNQMFYIKNSSGNNFNSSNEDGIQRHNFGKRETDTAIVQPLNAIYEDPNRPYNLNEKSGVRVDMFSRDELPVMKVTLDLSNYPAGDYAVDNFRIDLPLGAVSWSPKGRFNLDTPEGTINLIGTQEGESVYEFDIAGFGEDGLNMYSSVDDSDSLSVEATFFKNIVGGEIAGERPKMVAINLVNLDTEEYFFVDFSVKEETEDSTETVSIAGIVFAISNSNDETIISYRNESFDPIEGEVFVSHIITESSENLEGKAFEVYLQNPDDSSFTYVGRKGANSIPDIEDVYAVNVSSKTQGILPEIPSGEGVVLLKITETNITNIQGVAITITGEGQQVFWVD